jgi:HK97 family phage portal protein
MSIENPAVPLTDLDEDDPVWGSLTGDLSASGAKVNRRKALGHSAIWRGVNLIAGDVGRHTFRVYQYAPGGGLIDAPGHPAAAVMRRPNPWMTPFTFRQTLQAHALLSGNGYAYIFRNPDTAQPLELWPLTGKTWPVRVNGEMWYVSQSSNPLPGKRRNAASYVKIRGVDMIHIHGLGFDGIQGYAVLQVLRETIGGALAARDYGSRYFKNDASPGVVLEVPASMPDKAIKMLRESWAELHVGYQNSHRPAILRDGVKLVTGTRGNARDAQLLENRQFDSRDIANILGIPPHKVGDPSRTAYNSLESENQGYHEDTLGRWFAVWEQECDAKLLTEVEKNTESHCCKFDPRPLSRVSLAARTAYYSAALMNGWLNVDEVRAEEGLNPLPGGLGKVYRNPVNLAPAAPAPAEPAPASEPQPTTDEVTSE